MKLYFSPSACSMAAHIVLREAGFAFDLERVDLRTGWTANDGEYRRINPKGYVPALELDDGQLLTEVVVILQYLAETQPGGLLDFPSEGIARYRLLEWLNFIATELHKTLGAAFNPALPPECKAVQLTLFERRADWLSANFGDGPFLMGKRFGIADAYLFTVLRWTSVVGIDMTRWPALQDYLMRVAERPAVRETLTAEGSSG
jgi:glutathione S-transferase